MIHAKTPGECDKASGASEAIYMPSDVLALATAKTLVLAASRAFSSSLVRHQYSAF